MFLSTSSIMFSNLPDKRLRLPDGKSELLTSSDSFNAMTAFLSEKLITEQPTVNAGRIDFTNSFSDIEFGLSVNVTPIAS